MSSFLKALVLVFLLVLSLYGEGKKSINIGVLSFRPIEETKAQLGPTIEYLKEQLPEYQIDAKILFKKDLDDAIEKRTIDFVFTNPEHLARLHHKYEIIPIVTLMQNVKNHPTNKFGGVIFTTTDRKEIKNLDDIKGRVVAIADDHSFGGFLIERWELYKKGYLLDKDYTVFQTDFPQDKVVNAVLTGKADIGFVRTGLLESMSDEMRLDINKIKILNPQNKLNAPFLLSTELYPEWGLGVFPDVDPHLSKTLAVALMDITSDMSCAQKGKYFGFTPPADYVDVETIMVKLGELPPTKQFDLADVINRYKFVMAVIGLALLRLIISTFFGLYKNNKGLKRALKAAKKITIRENMLDSLSDGVYGIDRNGVCTFINQPALDILGYTKEEFIDRIPHELIHPEKVFEEECKSCACAKDGIKRSWIDWFHTKNGESVAVSVKATPIFNSKGQGRGAVISFRDMSSLEDVGEVVSSLALVAENVDSGVIITDKMRRVKWVNHAFTNITGYSVEESIGKSPAILLQGKRSSNIDIAQIRRALNAGEEFSGEIINYRKNGEQYVASIAIKPIFNRQNEITGYFGVQVDITKKRENEIKLQHIAEEAESANKIKSEFLANMSHEIRTPLNGIMGFVSLLKQSDSLTEKEKSYAELIDKSSKTLLNILNDILDLSKIEADKMELDIKPHSPFEEYSQVLELFASMCAEKSVKPIAFVDPNLPSQIYADEIRLKQVLTNLLSNAVKFTNVYGFVKFDFRSEIISGHICKLLVSVSDNGIGMSEDTMSRLFNPFSQADNSTTRRYGGTGLGLSISKSLLNMMGSDINVKSQLGQGSEFSFEVEVDYDNSEPVWDIPENLRVALIANDFNDDLELFMEYMHSFGVNVSFISTFPKADEFDLFALHIDELTPTALMHTDIMHKCIIISGTQITTESLSNMLSPPFLPEKIFKLIKSILNMDEEVVPEVTTKPQFSGNVLIVDDNDVNVVLMQSILDEYGVKHVSAFDGCEAFKKYSENKFDLVLMDIHMPKCDGIMGLKLIRGLEVEKSLVKVPIVALTADAIKGKKDEMLAAGFDYYVTKPVSTESLESLFSKVLQQGEPIVITRKNDKKAIENIFFSSKKVAEELGIAEEGIIRSYEQFVRSAKESIVILRDAIESGNKELTRDVAHKIKGAAANLRIHIVSEATKIIEDDIFEKEESEIMNELTKIEGVITMLG